MEPGGNIQGEARITAHVLTGAHAVHPYGGVIVASLQMQQRAPPGGQLGQLHRAAVPHPGVDAFISNAAGLGLVGKRNQNLLRSGHAVGPSLFQAHALIVKGKLPISIQVFPVAPGQLWPGIIWLIAFHTVPPMQVMLETRWASLYNALYCITGGRKMGKAEQNMSNIDHSLFSLYYVAPPDGGTELLPLYFSMVGDEQCAPTYRVCRGHAEISVMILVLAGAGQLSLHGACTPCPQGTCWFCPRERHISTSPPGRSPGIFCGSI